jgi:uncharacterized membrane protein
VILRSGAVICTASLALGLVLRLLDMPAGTWVLTTGLVLLVAMPVARLLVSLLDLARQGEWRFVLTGLIVIILLIMTMF